MLTDTCESDRLTSNAGPDPLLIPPSMTPLSKSNHSSSRLNMAQHLTRI
jgi:hypothetical protein